MNSVPGRSGFDLARDREDRDARVCESYETAPNWLVPKSSSSDNGSTPEAASRTRATIVGRPAEILVVSSVTFGGLTSFTQERSVYGPARERPVKRSRPESTET